MIIEKLKNTDGSITTEEIKFYHWGTALLKMNTVQSTS